MKTIATILLGAIAIAAASGCTSETDDETIDVDTQSDALRNTGGGSGDPDECMAAKQGCYQTCAKSGSSSCYRWCDIVYSKCRGLPSPELTMMR